MPFRLTNAPAIFQAMINDVLRDFLDASNDGVGAVLSQQFEKDGKMHPCAFLLRWLSRAEQNYDVGNQEILAVKLALEEWRHWLEGAEQLFIVWTQKFRIH